MDAKCVYSSLRIKKGKEIFVSQGQGAMGQERESIPSLLHLRSN